MIWQRSAVHRHCGACSAVIQVGDPVLHVTDAYLSRCVACAKKDYRTEPPDTLEPLPTVAAPTAQPFASSRDLAQRFDVRMARTGESA